MPPSQSLTSVTAAPAWQPPTPPWQAAPSFWRHQTSAWRRPKCGWSRGGRRMAGAARVGSHGRRVSRGACGGRARRGRRLGACNSAHRPRDASERYACGGRRPRGGQRYGSSNDRMECTCGRSHKGARTGRRQRRGDHRAMAAAAHAGEARGPWTAHVSRRRPCSSPWRGRASTPTWIGAVTLCPRARWTRPRPPTHRYARVVHRLPPAPPPPRPRGVLWPTWRLGWRTLHLPPTVHRG